jgi:hypothetical protein
VSTIATPATHNLFLRQSYLDTTEEFTKVCKSSNPAWDYLILTASNENQAQAFRMQIDHRLAKEALPMSAHYAVLADPDGKRIGSGGATLNALQYIHNHAEHSKARKSLLYIQAATANEFRSIRPAASSSALSRACFITGDALLCLTNSA